MTKNMKKNNKKMICPICKSGTIKMPKSKKLSDKKIKVLMNKICVKKLLNEGFSYREIQIFLGYKSIASIQKLINKK